MELLVVLALISLLMAVLLASLRRARFSAERLRCVSNLKQIGGAWTEYLKDYNGRFFGDVNGHVTWAGWRGERRLTMYQGRVLNDPYLGLGASPSKEKAGIVQCRMDVGGLPEEPDPAVFLLYGNSYITNMCLIGHGRLYEFVDSRIKRLLENLNERISRMQLSMVTNPHNVVPLVGDYGWWLQVAPAIPQVDRDKRDDAAKRARRWWHQKSNCYNIAFLDGHVDFAEIGFGHLKGDHYNVNPFKDLNSLLPSRIGED
ncbi:MAG: type II secretion system GspH family protein [Planctomycetes bacterium]|jgi:prepilin-type processing-associated H-X9-DG protein|nr:type II secretion system GspH family protein [Planctomycetota bacterium]